MRSLNMLGKAKRSLKKVDFEEMWQADQHCLENKQTNNKKQPAEESEKHLKD